MNLKLSLFDSLDRFVSDLQKSLKPEEVVNLKSCKNCPYCRDVHAVLYCTQTSPPTRILSEYYAQGCIYYGVEEPVIGKDVTELATKADVESMKDDLAAMKATLASVGVMRTAQLLEKKGGGASLNTYSSDAEVYTYSTTWDLLREFNISTPTPPEGVTVYKYALMVSVELRSPISDYTMACKIEVDGEVLAIISEAIINYTWFDRAKEVTAGSHNVKIYLYRGGGASVAYLRGTRGTCGIGTVGTSEMKVATIQTSGEGKGSFEVVGKAYEDPVTVTGVLKADESESDKTILEVEVTADGSEYSNNASLETMLLEFLGLYGATTSEAVACFFSWFESTFLMAASS